MPYRNLHFSSLAKDLAIRTEIYNGEEHLVVPCVALVGDEVVYGMNAEGPEFIPAEELEFSTLGWSGRPVLPDHPSNSTSTANDPHTLQLMQFGQIFYPKFEDRKLKVEAWLGKERAKKVTGAVEVINKVEKGEMIELSVGAIISLDRKKGVSPSGKPYIASWFGIQSDHLAIGLNGSQGACNLEMGCGANRSLSCNSGGSDEVRSMRAMRGVGYMNNVPTEIPEPEKVADQPVPKPLSKVQKILSFASRIFRTNTEDEGLSDFDLRSRLWDVLYSIEPAFSGIEDVYQESKTVRYITNPTFPEAKMYLWRRTFEVGENDTVTVNDDREEVDFAVNYIYLTGKQAAEKGDSSSDKPCSCHDNDKQTETLMSKEDDPMADAPNSQPNTTPTAPSTPAQPTTPATPNAPATPPTTPQTPPSPSAPVSTAADTPAKELTEEEQIAQLPASLRSMVEHYRAQEKRERDSLVSALGKKQKIYTVEELNAKPVEELRKIADLAGVNQQVQAAPVGDYSGRLLAGTSTDEDEEVRQPPKPWSVALKKQKDQAAN